MKKYSTGFIAVMFLVIGGALPAHAAGLTQGQANSLVTVVQSAPGVPASAFVNIITAFSNITVIQAESLIAVVQSAPTAPASAFTDLLISFTADETAQPAPLAGTLIPSDTFVHFSAVIGDGKFQTYSLHLTNASTAPISFTQRVPNQPSWWNTGYNTNTLVLAPGDVMGVGVSADTTKITQPGTYSANLTISGNFANSPITIPVTFTVSAPTTITGTFSL